VLIHDPNILVLDEPASGLDPRARIEIRELLVEVARLGKTIIFSSHILADVAELCTRVGIMENAKLVAIGTLDQLSERVVPHRIIHISLLKSVELEQAQAVLATLPGIVAVRAQEGLNHAERITFETEFVGSDEVLHQLLMTLLEKGIPVVQFTEDTQNLEEVFMRATRGIVS
jgi:ABC-2 type transport system ATP-binding protein